MKKLSTHKILCLLLCAAALFSLCAVPAAAASTPVVTGYTSSLSSITMHTGAVLTVTIKDTGVKTSDISPDGTDASEIDISRLVDCFSTGTISEVTIDSALSDPLVYHFKLSGAIYSGHGSTLRFMAGYKSVADSYKQMELNIRECVEYVEPSVPDYEPSEPYIIPQPVVVIDRGAMDTVKPGEEFTLTVTVRNTANNNTLSNPVVTFTPSSAFIILDSTPTKSLENIKRGETATVRIRMKALAKIESPAQSVDVSVAFNYNSGDAGMAKGTVTQTVIIPVQTSVSEEMSELGAPQAVITRGDIPMVSPGEAFTLNVNVKNVGKTAMESPVLAVTPDSALAMLDATMSRLLDTIAPGASVTVPIKLMAKTSATSPSLSVALALSYSYPGGKGSSSETVLIPVDISAVPEQSAPSVVISRDALSAVQSNQDFTLNIKISNGGASALTAPVLSVSPDSALSMMDATRSRPLEDIQPGAVVTVPIKLRAADRIVSPSLPVALELSYTYAGSKATSAETVFVPAVPNADDAETPSRIEGATPNVILSQYSYGDAPQVAAGSSFDLSMEFRNTSASFTVENIVMTVSTGEGLAISSSSNTMFYPSLRAGDTQDQVIGITVLPTAKTGSAKIDVSFSYEYVDNQQRCKVNTMQSIAIPVYQPDRFEVELPALPEFVSAYEEMYISLPYVNKGKSEICNVRAELVSPDGAVSAINGVQNLGNFASGSSGTIDFIFTPQMSGQVDFSFAITYEDPNAQEKTVEFPVSLTVDEPYYPEYDPGLEGPGWEEPTEEKAGVPWWVWVIAGVVAVALVIVIVAVCKKKSKKNGDLDSFEWNPAAPSDADTAVGGREK